jgi:C1A family cysteine protease
MLKFQPGDTIEEIRDKIEHNGYNFTVGHNWVYDMSVESKEAFFRRFRPISPRKDVSDDIGPLERHLGAELPARFDWRDYNDRSYIGPVRNQEGCNACYAFAACAAAEGAYNKATDAYGDRCADFSESFIAWCLGKLDAYNKHFFGCDGADYDYYELEALTNEGIINEKDFPYVDSDPGECTHWDDQAITFLSWHRIECGDIDAIKTAIMTYGVVDAAVFVAGAFQAYTSGIYEDSNTTCDRVPCYYTPTNHAIALVGWDDNGGNGYWILRNSWGTDWGERGYMKIKYDSALVACEVAYLVSNAPTVTTGSAHSLTAYSAAVNATVNPNGAETTYYFEYGTTDSYGSTTTADSAGSGSRPRSVSADLTGLSAGVTYHYRLVAANSYGTTRGDGRTFTTLSQPTVTTGSALFTGSDSVTLNGTVNPNGAETTYYFEYGTTDSYGSTTTAASAGSGESTESVSADLTGLSPDITYHYRLVAENDIGSTRGDGRTFIIGADDNSDYCFITTAACGSQ